MMKTAIVKDGEVTVRELTDEEVAEQESWQEPINWHTRIESHADTELQRGVFVTIGGVTYGIRTGSTALALIGGGAITAEKARQAGQTVTEKVPTDKGIVAFDSDGLDAIFEATRAHRAAIMDRVEELEAMVRDGSIQEIDLEQWP